MDCSIIIATCGEAHWSELARTRAYPSALAQDAREVLIDHFPRLTVAAARNELAGRALGAWLCHLDADDRLADGYITAMGAEERPNALLIPRVQYFQNGIPEPGLPVFPNRDRPIEEMNHGVVGTLVPAELCRQVGGFGEERTNEDWALWLACLRAGVKLVYVEDAIYEVFVSKNSRNTDQSNAETIRRKHLQAVWELSNTP